jgi:hypothetical protein
LCEERRRLEELRRKFEESIDFKLAKNVLAKLKPVKKNFGITTVSRLAEAFTRKYQEPTVLRRLLDTWRGTVRRQKLNLATSEALSTRRSNKVKARILDFIKTTTISNRSSPEHSDFGTQVNSPMLVSVLPDTFVAVPVASPEPVTEASLVPTSPQIRETRQQFSPVPFSLTPSSPKTSEALLRPPPPQPSTVNLPQPDTTAQRLPAAVAMSLMLTRLSCFPLREAFRRLLTPPPVLSAGGVFATRQLTRLLNAALVRSKSFGLEAFRGPLTLRQFPVEALVAFSEKRTWPRAQQMAQIFQVWRSRVSVFGGLAASCTAALVRQSRPALLALRRHAADAKTADTRLYVVEFIERKARHSTQQLVFRMWRNGATWRQRSAVEAAKRLARIFLGKLQDFAVFADFRLARDKAKTMERGERLKKVLERQTRRLMVTIWRLQTRQMSTTRAELDKQTMLRGWTAFRMGLVRRRGVKQLVAKLGRVWGEQFAEWRRWMREGGAVLVTRGVLLIGERRMQREVVKRNFALWRLAWSEAKSRRERQFMVTGARELELLRDEVKKAAKRVGLSIN